MLRGLLVAGMLAILLGCVAFGNVAPTMEDQYVTTDVHGAYPG